MTNTVPCRDCREPVKISVSKCPHCATRQYTKSYCVGLGVMGALLTGAFGWLILAVPEMYDLDSLLAMAATGVTAGLALSGPLIILGAITAWRERKKDLPDQRHQQATPKSVHDPQDARETTWTERHPRTVRVGKYALLAFGALFLVFISWGLLGEAGWTNVQSTVRTIGDGIRYLFFILVAGTVLAWMLDYRDGDTPI